MLNLDNQEISKAIIKIRNLPSRRPNQSKRKYLELRKLGIILLYRPEEVVGNDCQDWAFTRLKLPQYSYRKGGRIFETLLQEGLPELEEISELEENALVLYDSMHYGVGVCHTKQLMVESKWGTYGEVFIHPLKSVPTTYGTKAHFFRKTT